MRLLGIDPGLRHTGWGIIDVDGNRLSHVANGVIDPPVTAAMAIRLKFIFDGLNDVLAGHAPAEAAVEETFVNKNPDTTLKLGLARGAALLAPAIAGLRVHEYATRLVKKSVVGTGRADKGQIGMMVAMLLPGAAIAGEDAADALAVAICHAHHAATKTRQADRRVEEVRA
jgi:crossover junction endodeoxyribonuclease RuvC